ncbi:MFS transporter [Rickettsiales endosymbiont of Paramecium tredecaurelia]|uniref:MFS transporter n=1 Tax=Candidatus Sarmatiella mevalonica TaxID=2770581 RepID=UPI0019225466|nr:MFS transporter [Candidatus Sarmatiella mevalonica]MBL3284185.1 MFS transporter [Candidatus Sarmatiella mevalonica]
MPKIFSKDHAIVFYFGIISGFSLVITSSNLNYLLAANGVSLSTVGLFSLVSLPYSISFFWLPIIEYFSSLSGHRVLANNLLCICFVQYSLALLIYLLSNNVNTHQEIVAIGSISFCIASLSSIQDGLLGGMRGRIVAKQNQPFSCGFYVCGYRAGMLCCSSGAIYYSAFYSWQEIYRCLSLIVLLFNAGLLFLFFRGWFQENQESLNEREIVTVYDAIVSTRKNSAKSIIKRYLSALWPEFDSNNAHYNSGIKFALIVLFLIVYRLPDNCLNLILTPFLLHVGYNAQDIAISGKLLGSIGAILGGVVGGAILSKKTIRFCLIWFCAVHSLAHVLYIYQDLQKCYWLFIITTILESITCGMTMSAYLAFINSLCTGKFKATQYSLFTSFLGLARAILPSISGYLVELCGWRLFFLAATFTFVPSWIIINKIYRSYIHDR